MSYATLRTIAPEEQKVETSILPEITSNIDRESYMSKYKVVVVENYARWCGPCKMIVGPLNELYNKYHRDGVCVIVKENAELSLPNQRLKLKPQAVPCFHFYVNGTLADTIMGADVRRVEENIVQLVSTN
jgi:thiol-disulfide isomerase/thioredoxin